MYSAFPTFPRRVVFPSVLRCARLPVTPRTVTLVVLSRSLFFSTARATMKFQVSTRYSAGPLINSYLTFVHSIMATTIASKDGRVRAGRRGSRASSLAYQTKPRRRAGVFVTGGGSIRFTGSQAVNSTVVASAIYFSAANNRARARPLAISGGRDRSRKKLACLIAPASVRYIRKNFDCEGP